MTKELGTRWKKAQNAERKFWEDHSNEQQGYYQQLEILKKNKIKTKDRKILEIGSGAFGILNVIKEGHKYAIDPLMNFFMQKFNLPRKIKRFQGRGEELPFQKSFFDIIFCVNTLDHVDNPEKVLQEAQRCLKKNKPFFLTLNCYSPQIVALRKFSEEIGAGDICHPHNYSITGIKKLLEKTGFEIKNITKGSHEHNPEKIQKKSFFEKTLETQKLRGTRYLLIRTLILPVHFLFGILFRNYPDTSFLCLKTGGRK